MEVRRRRVRCRRLWRQRECDGWHRCGRWPELLRASEAGQPRPAEYEERLSRRTRRSGAGFAPRSFPFRRLPHEAAPEQPGRGLSVRVWQCLEYLRIGSACGPRELTFADHGKLVAEFATSSFVTAIW